MPIAVSGLQNKILPQNLAAVRLWRRATETLKEEKETNNLLIVLCKAELRIIR
jgi:hypothetical protein